MIIDELKQRKKELGFTNEKIAELAGVSLESVEKMFNCDVYSNITYEERLAIENALKEEVSDCVREEAAAYIAKKQGNFTVDDYYTFPDDVHVELIDGVIYDMGAPSTTHQSCVFKLAQALDKYISDNKGQCVTFVSSVDVQLDCDDKTMVQPDVLVVCDKSKIMKRCIFGAPDMVIEVLSPSTKKIDLTIKPAKYMNAGVREYWIVDLDKKRVLVYDWKQDDIMKIYGFDDKVPVGIFNEKFEVDFQGIYQKLGCIYE